MALWQNGFHGGFVSYDAKEILAASIGRVVQSLGIPAPMPPSSGDAWTAYNPPCTLAHADENV
jgi:hypothetical protein